MRWGPRKGAVGKRGSGGDDAGWGGLTRAGGAAWIAVEVRRSATAQRAGVESVQSGYGVGRGHWTRFVGSEACSKAATGVTS